MKRSATRFFLIQAAALCFYTDPMCALSISDEIELGRNFAFSARERLPLINDVEVDRYVSELGRRIVAAVDDPVFDYHFNVLHAARINAFAVPGGHIYLHSGLLLRVESDEELAGVLGHEVAHVHARHLARQKEATQLLDYATLVGVLLSVVQPAIGAGALAINQSLQLKYRREFEQEADYLGLRLMRGAGFHPRGMLAFFRKMLDEQRMTPTFAPPYMLSHPLTETRLTNISAVLDSLRSPEKFQASDVSRTLALERVQLLTSYDVNHRQRFVESYHRRAENHPDDGRSQYLLGLAQLTTGAYGPAYESLEKARALGLAESEREIGRVLLGQGKIEKARARLERVVKASSADAVAQLALAQAREADGDADGAIEMLRRALALAPRFAEAHHHLGRLAGRAGLKGEGFYHLGRAHELRGQYPQALTHLEKAVERLPDGDPRAVIAKDLKAQLRDYLKLSAR